MARLYSRSSENLNIGRIRSSDMPVTVEEMNNVSHINYIYPQGCACPVPYLQKQPYVYFVQSSDGYVKIGTTRHIKSRVGKIQVDNHMRIKLIGKMKGGFDLELKLHLKFKRYRKRGEWFHPAPELIEYIAENNINKEKT